MLLGGKSGQSAPQALCCAVLFGLCAAAGCGGDGDAPACEAAFEPCDVAEPTCHEVMSEALACLTGARAVTPSVETWDDDDALGYFTPASQTREQDLLMERQLKALSLLRLVPEGYSPEQAIETYSESVGTFYDPAQDRIVVVEHDDGELASRDADDDDDDPAGMADDGRDAGTQPHSDALAFKTMVHELTHAARDQRTPLGAFYQQAGSTDAWLAARAVVEGEALLYAELAWLDAIGRDPADMDWAQLLEPNRMETLAAFVALAAPYSLVDRYLPYPYGFAYVLDAWQHGGTDAVDGLYAAPPRSTRAITAGYRAELSDSGAPALLESQQAVPQLPESYAPVGAGQLGVWLVDASIQRFADEPTYDLSWPLLQRLEGDVVSLYHDLESDRGVAFWRLRFSDADAAEALGEAAHWQPQVQVTVDGVDAILMAIAEGGPELDLEALQWQAVVIAAPTPTPTAVANPLLAATPAPL